MRRLLVGSLAFAALTGTVLVLPVYAAPAPEPVPVAGDTHEVAMGSVADPAPAADVQQGTTDPVQGVPASAPTLTVEKNSTSDFSLVGVTWAYDAAVTDTVVQVRVKKNGHWGSWTEVQQEDADLDAGHASGTRGGTSPLWTGPSAGVQAELVTRSGAQPTDVQLDLIDPGDSPADAVPGAPDITDTAHAATDMPDVYSRAQWGADEHLMTWAPEMASTIKAATLHHTADSNDYTADQVPDMMRAIYRYQAVDRGWGDIGYNVVVDKFGRLWEGRAGGLANAVIGAHAGGFNRYTFGVSMLGNYDLVDTPQPMIDSVAAIIAWKFDLFGVDPAGTTTLVAAGGSGTTAKYADGTPVTLPTIFGHKDVGRTACPGRYGYARLPQIRAAVAQRMTTISSRYAADARLRTVLGASTGPEQTEAGVTWQQYANGRMYSSPTTGVHVLAGDILAKYLALGGPQVLGGPTTDQGTAPDGIGRFNQFADAAIYWTPATGAHVVMGAIRGYWAAAGWERSSFGYPTTDELASPDGTARYTGFQKGTVTWTPATGAHGTWGAIGNRWTALGGFAWGQGAPTTEPLFAPDGAGRFSFFAGGAAIYWHPWTGAHSVLPPVRTLWGRLGWERGPLGYPAAEETVAPDGTTRSQRFFGGTVYGSPTTGVHAVYGAIGTAYLQQGGPESRLGLPTRDEYAVAGGRRTDFQHGTLTWSARTGAVTATYR